MFSEEILTTTLIGHVSLYSLSLSFEQIGREVCNRCAKMHSIKIHSVINHIISIFYYIGFWHRGDVPTTKELKIKLFYCIYYALFTVAITIGAFTKKNRDESIFLAQIALGTTVLGVKMWLFVWKQKQVLELLDRICAFSIRDDDDFIYFNRKLNAFIHFVIALLVGSFATTIFQGTILPFLGNERTIVLKVWLPVDWENDEIAFWIAFVYVFTGNVLAVATVLFTIIIWYLMIHCSLRYRLLGTELTKLGDMKQEGKEKISDELKCAAYLRDLTTSIDDHLNLKE